MFIKQLVLTGTSFNRESLQVEQESLEISSKINHRNFFHFSFLIIKRKSMHRLVVI